MSFYYYFQKKAIDVLVCERHFNEKALEKWTGRVETIIHDVSSKSKTVPAITRETLEEYCKRTRELANELLKGISKSLGLEENYISKKMNVETGTQMFVANFYPPCPQPEIAMGLPPHSDYGLLTLLIQNELTGLQVMHNGKWVPINPLPDSILINTGDHMEILTNGKYKSVFHRAVVNNKGTRISVGTAHGPPLDSVVSPAPELTQEPAAYRGITFRDYIQLQQTSQVNGKNCLDHVRI